MRQDVHDPARLRVSFVIATYNRRAVLLETLGRVRCCGLRCDESEILVVDNASTDGTAVAVRERFPEVNLLSQPTNRGPCAKNAGIAAARGEFVVFLDDDSWPQPGSVGRMLEHFAGDPSLGAAVFAVTLPDGSEECSAYPDVCIGCGTGFRRTALLQVGGLPDNYFMAAEEYDLSLRLLDAGWGVRRFEDLRVTHLKSPVSRYPKRIARLDARNNVMLAMRHFPEPWRMRYAMEWLERYRLMAKSGGCRAPFWMGTLCGLARGLGAAHQPMQADAFERFSRLDATRDRFARVARQHGLRRVMFLDLGKNILAYRLAAEACGVQIVGIADQRLGGRGLSFRGIPVVSDAQALRTAFDAAIVTNLSPVHARRRRDQWRRLQSEIVVDLFEAAAAATAAATAA